MKQLKIVLVSIAIGVAVGMWFGYNMGRGEPFYSNPFETRTIGQKIKQMGGETLEKGGQSLEKAGQSLQDTLSK